jgi:hypothetical protein
MKQSERDLLSTYIESQGIDDPHTISDIISKTDELKDKWDQFKSSETVRRAGDIMKYKNDRPGAAKFTKVGEISGNPIYQEDLDMIKLAKPFINKILKNKGVDVSELNTGPDTTENVNEVRVDDKPVKECEPQGQQDIKPMTNEEFCNLLKAIPKQHLEALKEARDRAKNAIDRLNPDNLLKDITPGQMKESFDKTQEANICMGIRRDEEPEDKKDPGDYYKYSNILKRMEDTHARKNSDYGDAAYKGYKKYGDYYFLSILHNKLSRLETLTVDNKTQQVKDESIDDTLLDMANYAVMYLESRHRND